MNINFVIYTFVFNKTSPLSFDINGVSQSWKTRNQRGLNTKKGPCSSSFFWAPQNLSHHMDRQARTGDSVN